MIDQQKVVCNCEVKGSTEGFDLVIVTHDHALNSFIVSLAACSTSPSALSSVTVHAKDKHPNSMMLTVSHAHLLQLCCYMASAKLLTGLLITFFQQ